MRHYAQKIIAAIMFALLGLAVFRCTSTGDDGRLQALVETAALHSHATNNVSLRLLRSGIRVFELDENAGHRHAVILTDQEAALLEIGVPVFVRSEYAAGHDHGVFLQLLSD